MHTKPNVIVIAGPTCVGKTSVSISLAQMLRTEIISADSMQIYRHMDIGTEKPTPAQRALVRHNMVDIAEPSEQYSAGRYVEDAGPIIDRLLDTGKPPIVTGGTGLYIKALTRGLFKGPSADWGMRQSLNEMPSIKLYAKLRALDPEAASAIMPGDKRRVVRALEVCLKTGRKMSDLMTEGTSALPYHFIKFALFRQRSELYHMIEDRVDRMFENGLVLEVRALLKLNPSKTPMQAIGYKETASYLRGDCTLDEAVRLIKRNTKRYAKRQMTWFRKEQDTLWIDITGVQDIKPVVDKIHNQILLSTSV